MRRTLLLSLSCILALILIVSACGDDNTDVGAENPDDKGDNVSDPATRPSVGGEWILVGLKVDGDDVTLVDSDLRIVVASGEVTGNLGCNSFFGSFAAADDGTLVVGGLGQTEMACEGKMDFESVYGPALSSVTAWNVDPEGMTLAGDTAELRFEQAPAPVDLPLEATVWRFDTIFSGEGVNRVAENRADMDGVTLTINGSEATIVGLSCAGQTAAVEFDGTNGGEFRTGAVSDSNTNPGCAIVGTAMAGLIDATGYMIAESRLTFIGLPGETVGFVGS
jgi:heat shock protein HslJ